MDKNKYLLNFDNNGYTHSLKITNRTNYCSENKKDMVDMVGIN
jgi:hypothetical protein